MTWIEDYRVVYRNRKLAYRCKMLSVVVCRRDEIDGSESRGYMVLCGR